MPELDCCDSLQAAEPPCRVSNGPIHINDENL